MCQAMDMSSYKQYLQKTKEKYLLERDNIMCNALKNLAGKTADELLKGANLIGQIPVDLGKLITHWGVSVLPFDFTDLQEKLKNNGSIISGNILGLVVAQDDNLGIYYKSDDTVHRQRFTIAHELAHCCIDYEHLEKNSVNFRLDNAIDEAAVNIFAGEILMPETSLKDAIRNMGGIFSGELANMFNVSETAMNARLNYLKLF